MPALIKYAFLLHVYMAAASRPLQEHDALISLQTFSDPAALRSALDAARSDLQSLADAEKAAAKAAIDIEYAEKVVDTEAKIRAVKEKVNYFWEKMGPFNKQLRSDEPMSQSDLFGGIRELFKRFGCIRLANQAISLKGVRQVIGQQVMSPTREDANAASALFGTKCTKLSGFNAARCIEIVQRINFEVSDADLASQCG